MPSPVGVRRTEARVRVWSVTRSTTASTCSAGRFAARTWRCASPRTCQTCQVERRAAISSRTRMAVSRTHAASTVVAGAARLGDRAVVTMAATPAGSPRTASACAPRLHVVRSGCGVRVWRRGSPGWPAGRAGLPRPRVGGRPWSPWNVVASSPRRASIAARRVDQRWFRTGSTPTTSRIGRFPGSVPGRGAKVSPRRVRRCFSRAVL